MDEQIEHEENDVQAENSAPQINQTPPVGLDRNRKIAVAVLGLMAFVTIIFWSKNLQNQLTDPFTYKGGDADVAEKTEDDSEIALRLKDTDNDGLNDWDELNVYLTSPYLEDSDSDGFKDSEEITNGNNPNCAAGAECEVTELISDTSEGITGTANENEVLKMLGQNTTDLMLTMNDVSEIRKVFIELGYDKNKLDTLSDEDVYKMFLAAQGAYSKNQGNTSTTAQTETTTISSDDASAIRAAYEKAGYKKEDLDKISDEDLIKAYKEALQTYENNPSSGGVN